MNQIHHGWSQSFGSSQEIVEVVERLVRARLLDGDVRNLQLPPVTDEPLCDWVPGEPDPNFERIEYLVQSRWCGQEVPTPIVAATEKACRLFGSNAGGMPPLTHLNHDLLLGEVFARYRCQQPEVCASWLGEDAVEIAERGVKNPDAFLFDTRGHVTKVVESAGKYSLSQLESFHRHCKSANLPYELW
tara:strand:- start:36506 stop:37069 length:564 start_codon:yes stop_codon:yes gene_type:complete